VIRPLLSVEHLTTVLDRPSGPIPIVSDVCFSIARGETLGLVGESGSGKSLTALSVMGLLDAPLRIAAGDIVLDGRVLTSLDESAMRGVRGAQIGLIFQEPAAALDPVSTIGAQIAEALLVHKRASGRAAAARAVELLAQMRLRDPRACANAYAHQLSGGMRQRAMIAMALACDPPLLIADEPTTALDATVQAQVLDLLRELQAARGLALLLISHDLAVVGDMASRIAVMYAGRIVEEGPVRSVLRTPAHPYTQGLLASRPTGTPGQRLRPIPGAVPSVGHMPDGCAFHPRCAVRIDRCRAVLPVLASIVPPSPDHRASCLLVPTSH
jgi:oligopeptide/dipeptide ABC transporter ATP-binding protein